MINKVSHDAPIQALTLKHNYVHLHHYIESGRTSDSENKYFEDEKWLPFEIPKCSIVVKFILESW